MGVPTAEELQIALREAARLREQGEDPYYLAKTVLNHNHRIQKLERVMHAVELYFRSGNASQEHTNLVRAIEAAKHADSNSTDSDKLDYGL